MNQERIVIESLRGFREHVLHSPGSGHNHLYDEFDDIIRQLSNSRINGHNMQRPLIEAILDTVKVLVKENCVGRRPWEGNWETYFHECIDNALQLVQVLVQFDDYKSFVPNGYCNFFTDVFSSNWIDEYGFPRIVSNIYRLLANKGTHIKVNRVSPRK